MQPIAMLMEILLSTSGGFSWGFQHCPSPYNILLTLEL